MLSKWMRPTLESPCQKTLFCIFMAKVWPISSRLAGRANASGEMSSGRLQFLHKLTARHAQCVKHQGSNSTSVRMYLWCSGWAYTYVVATSRHATVHLARWSLTKRTESIALYGRSLNCQDVDANLRRRTSSQLCRLCMLKALP